MVFLFFFFFKQKTAYEISVRDWSSDVCSSDLNTSSSSEASPETRNASVSVTRPTRPVWPSFIAIAPTMVVVATAPRAPISQTPRGAPPDLCDKGPPEKARHHRIGAAQVSRQARARRGARVLPLPVQPHILRIPQRPHESRRVTRDGDNDIQEARCCCARALRGGLRSRRRGPRSSSAESRSHTRQGPLPPVLLRLPRRRRARRGQDLPAKRREPLGQGADGSALGRVPVRGDPEGRRRRRQERGDAGLEYAARRR